MPEHLDRVPTHSTKVEEDVNNGTHQLLQSCRAPVVTQPSLLGFLIQFFVQKVFNQSSVVSGGIALYIGVHFRYS